MDNYTSPVLVPCVSCGEPVNVVVRSSVEKAAGKKESQFFIFFLRR
jgi:hypothetical protein